MRRFDLGMIFDLGVGLLLNIFKKKTTSWLAYGRHLDVCVLV